MNRVWIGLPRERIVEEARSGNIPPFAEHADGGLVPIGNAVQKIRAWKDQDATITYMTSRTKPAEIQTVKNVLKKHGFPDGELFFRREGETYADAAERASPDIIVEDDCESIGGEKEMIYTHMKSELKKKTKHTVVREFGGIDHLPNKIKDL